MTAALEGLSGQQHAPAAIYPRKDPVPILQKAGWALGPVWTGGNSRPHRDSILDRPARSQSLYRLSYPAHHTVLYYTILYYNILYYTTPYHTIPYHIIHHTIPHHTIPHHTIPHHTIPHHTTPYRTTPYHTIPHHTIPYTTPYHIIPYHEEMHYSVINAYNLLHNCYIFLRCYLAIFRELTPKFL